MKKSYLKKLKRLKIMDDDFARVVFADKKAGLEILKILDIIKDESEVIHYETQKDMKNLFYRSVFFDIQVVSNNSVTNIEIENSKDRASPKRARYHSSIIDMQSLNPCESFNDLPWNIVVFICSFDYYKEGLPYYTIERIVKESGQPFKDQSLIIYLNGKYEGNDKYGRLIHDLKCTNPKEMYNEVLRKSVEYFKKTKRGMKKMCKIWDEIRRDGEQRGEQKGKLKAEVNSLRQVMTNLNYSLEQAMNFLSYPLSDKEKYKRLLKV